VTSSRAMPSLIMLAAVAFSSVFTPILGGSLQPFFGQFMKLAKEEQGLIKQQNLILEKILQAQDMMAQGQSGDSIIYETSTLKSEHGDIEPDYATATLRPEHGGDYMSHDFPNYGKQKGRGYQKADEELLEESDNGIPREWVDKYRARKGDGNSLYLTIPRNHPDGDAHYFNGDELMAAAKESRRHNRIVNGNNKKRGRGKGRRGNRMDEIELILNDDGSYSYIDDDDDDNYNDPDDDDDDNYIVPDDDDDDYYNDHDPDDQDHQYDTIESTEQESRRHNRIVNGNNKKRGRGKGRRGNRMDDSENVNEYQMGDGGPWGRNRMQAGESYSDDALPREWMDKYNARQGDGNSLYMTIPRDGNAHYFNVKDLKDAARGK